MWPNGAFNNGNGAFQPSFNADGFPIPTTFGSSFPSQLFPQQLHFDGSALDAESYNEGNQHEGAMFNNGAAFAQNQNVFMPNEPNPLVRCAEVPPFDYRRT